MASLPPAAGLDLDLLCLLGRLEQIQREAARGGDDGPVGHFLWERIVSTDVPRLRAHISAAALAWEASLHL